eukprot:TRINITY_DN2357_c8_g1_i1.p1 TRINITY_DN2357_c8_g1~~TRINITY_DN2357_c8_g1_i1.p1  ORF type:complete len:1594 (+),score=367.89 TRINITY_DN2357_c8_g1_i1:94-4875(+)
MRSHPITLLMWVWPVAGPTTAAERNALRQLYTAAFGGAANPWRRYQNWMTGDPCDNAWQGVTCVAGKVTRVDLRDNRLRGNLANNVLRNLPNLEYFDIAHNSMLTGNFPSNELAFLPNLNTLNVGDDSRPGLSGPFPDWTQLPNPGKMDRIEIWGDFTGNIPTFAPLNNLRILRIDHTEIDGTIPDFTPLANIESLVIEDNGRLTGTIPDFTNQGKATTIGFHNNPRLSGTIPDLQPLRSVTNLYIQYNDVSGTVPASLSTLNKLEYLSLAHNCGSYCDLSGTVPTLHPNLRTSLKRLYLFHNAFEGLPAIEPRPTTLDVLTDLRFEYNLITGTFPCHSTAFPSLVDAQLHHNRMTGTIPCIDDFKNLKTFYAGTNYFTGTLPQATVANSLEVFDIDHNRLSGTIPQGFVDSLTVIKSLELGANEFSGTIPQLRTNADLETIHVHRNMARKPLTPVVTAGDATTNPNFGPLLDGDPNTVYTCTPTCEIMLDFGQEVCLEALEMRTGPDTRPAFSPTKRLRPAEGCPTAVHIYQASVGNTAGQTSEASIPAWDACCDWNWDSCEPGTWKDLGHERISDHVWGDWDSFCKTKTRYYRVRISGCDGKDCRIADLRAWTGDRMTGTLPDLASVPKLRNLWAFGNDLTGTLPLVPGQNSWDGGSIRVDDNHLEGPLPDLCPTLDRAAEFWVDDNDISGTIPAMACLTMMRSIRVRDNTLSGTIPDCDCRALTEFIADNNACCRNWEQEWLRTHTSVGHGASCPRCGGPSPWPVDCDPPFTSRDDCPWANPDWGDARRDPCKHEWPGGGLEGHLPDFATMPNIRYFSVTNNKMRGPLAGRNVARLTRLEWFRAFHNRLAGTVPYEEMDQAAVDHSNCLDQSFYLNNNTLWGTMPDIQLSLSRSKCTLGNHHGGSRNDGRRWESLQIERNHLWGDLPGHLELVQDWVTTRYNCWNCPLTPQGVYDIADGNPTGAAPPIMSGSGLWFNKNGVPGWAPCINQPKESCRWRADSCNEPPAVRYADAGPSCPAEAANSLYASTVRCGSGALEIDRTINEDDIRLGTSFAVQFQRSRYENGVLVEVVLPFFAPGLWDCPPAAGATPGPYGPGTVAMTPALQAAVRDSMVSQGAEPAGWNALRASIAPVAGVQLGPSPGADPYVDLPTELWVTTAADSSFDITQPELVEMSVPAEMLLGPFGHIAEQPLNFTIVPSPGVASGSWLPGGQLDELDFRYGTAHQLGRHVNATWTLALGETFTCAARPEDCVEAVVTVPSAVPGQCPWACAKAPASKPIFTTLSCSPYSIEVEFRLGAYDLPDGGRECVNVSLTGKCVASGLRPCSAPMEMCVVAVTEPGPTPTPSIPWTRTRTHSPTPTTSDSHTPTRPDPTPTPTPTYSPTATWTVLRVCQVSFGARSTVCVEGDMPWLPYLVWLLGACCLLAVAAVLCVRCPRTPPAATATELVPALADADELTVTAKLPPETLVPAPQPAQVVTVRAVPPPPPPPAGISVRVRGVAAPEDVTVRARPVTPAAPDVVVSARPHLDDVVVRATAAGDGGITVRATPTPTPPPSTPSSPQSRATRAAAALPAKPLDGRPSAGRRLVEL